jgi:hypothetical protein
MMKVHRTVLLFLFCCIFYGSAYAQQPKFVSCTAAFLDGKLVVNEYSPEGKCMLDSTATGILTVSPSTYENDKWTADYEADFMVAVRDRNTGTLWMYSDKRYKKLDIAKVLAKCRKGDRIVLLTLDDLLALPHNEILIL